MRNPITSPGAEDGAMTEVALALAMGFFSILVLTLWWRRRNPVL
jgi:hypothetical protein